MQTKTGQDLPKENLGEGLDEILGSYMTELGLNDKEAEALEHLQASLWQLFAVLCWGMLCYAALGCA